MKKLIIFLAFLSISLDIKSQVTPIYKPGVPYSGATTSLNLGANSFSVNNSFVRFTKIGTDVTPSTNVNLWINKNITANTVGSVAHIYTDGLVGSTATTTAAYYQSVAGTIAGTYTIPILYHFDAQKGTFGAGSSITEQGAFHASSTIVSATNNYGYWGEIPAATGRWNLYCNGTAQNYLQGNLSIGTSTTSNKLHVVGGAEITTTLNVTGQTSLSTFSASGTGTVNALVTNTNSTLNGQTSLNTFSASGTGTMAGLRSSGTGSFGTTFSVTGQTSLSTFSASGTGTANALISNTTFSCGTNATITGQARLTNTVNVLGNTTLNSASTVTSTMPATSGTIANLSDATFCIPLFAQGGNFADASTYYFGNLPFSAIGAPQGWAKVYVPYNCTLVGWTANFYTAGGVGSAETSTLSLGVDNSTYTTLSSAITMSAATSVNTYSASGLSTNVNAGSYIEARLQTGTWATNPLTVVTGITLTFVRRQ